MALVRIISYSDGYGRFIFVACYDISPVIAIGYHKCVACGGYECFISVGDLIGSASRKCNKRDNKKVYVFLNIFGASIDNNATRAIYIYAPNFANALMVL